MCYHPGLRDDSISVIYTLTLGRELYTLLRRKSILSFGTEPFLECSSKGDKRFSAFYAKVKGQSIEDRYQACKMFEDGTTGYTWKEVKGKKPVNIEECREMYSKLWNMYFEENPELLEVIKKYNGFTDIFGQKDHACQAEEIYKIRKSTVG